MAGKMWKKNVKIHPVLASRFASNLKDLRTKKGLTHDALAPMVGITGPYVSLLEAAKRTPSLEIVERFASVFGVDPSVMLKEVKS